MKLFFSLLCATGLIAHDLYLMPATFHPHPGQQLLVSIHNGDAFPESEVPPVLTRLYRFQLLTTGITTDLKNIRVLPKSAAGDVQLPSSPATLILTAATRPNILAMDAAHFIDYLKDEGLTNILDWRAKHGESNTPSRERYQKFAKALVNSGAPSKFGTLPVGLPIEIVPLQNPATLTTGQPLPILVLYNGKPAPGLQVELAWSQNGTSKRDSGGRTDTAGRLDLRTHPGLCRLSTVFMERTTDDAAANWNSYWATLTFQQE